MPQEIMRSIHDNNIYSIEIRCEENIIILHTNFLEEDASEHTDVIFSGVMGHRFENVLEGNLIIDIEEWEPEKFYIAFETALQTYCRYGFPLIFSNSEGFCIAMLQKKLKAFVIDSSYGLFGWVIANNMILQEK